MTNKYSDNLDKDREFIKKLVDYYIEIEDYKKRLVQQQERICTFVGNYLTECSQKEFTSDYCVAELTLNSNANKKIKKNEKVIVLMDKLIEQDRYEAIKVKLHHNFFQKIIQSNIGINEYIEFVKNKSITNKKNLIKALDGKINYHSYLEFDMNYIEYALNNGLIEKSVANAIKEVLGPPILKISRKGATDEICAIKQSWDKELL